MKFFGRVRSGAKPPPEPFSTPQSTTEPPKSRPMVLGSPKDKYGMMDYDEKEMPSPAYDGVQAVTGKPFVAEEETVPVESSKEDDGNGAETGDDTQPETTSEGNKKKKKKKKKKKLKKKKKKPSSDAPADDDMPIVVDRVPTAMEYESDDSIEKMIDERSRYSRYTTEYDELDLETFDDGEESEEATDKYAGAGTVGQIVTVMSDDSNPPVWRSWDEEEEKKKTTEAKRKKAEKKKKRQNKKENTKEAKKKGNQDRASVDGTADQSGTSISKKPSIGTTDQSGIYNKPSAAEMSGKSKGSQKKKKYQDLREFRKSHSTDKQKPSSPALNQNLEEEVYSPYTLPDFNTPLDTGESVQGSNGENGSRKSVESTKEDVVDKSDSAAQKKAEEIGKKTSTDQADNDSRRSQDSKANSRGSRDSKKGKKSDESDVPVSNSESWIAYNTFSGTFEKSKTSIPPVMSDTSSLTDPLKRHEKYAAQVAAQREDEEGPPREISAAKPPKMDKSQIRAQSLIHSWSTSKDTASPNGVAASNQQLLPAASSSSSDNHPTRYRVAGASPLSAGDGTWAPSPNAKNEDSGRMKEIDRRLGEINEAQSGSTSSSSRRRSVRDRYTEIKERHSNSTEAKSNRSSLSKKKVPPPVSSNKQEDVMYTKSLMAEDESYATSSVPVGRGERTKRGQMKELDEYSVAISVQDDPALVQCLKFYHCAGAALLTGFTTGWMPSKKAVTKEVKMLGRGQPDLDEVDKMRYRDHGLGPISPKVEVVLEEDDDDDSTLDGGKRDDGTVDAPDLKASVPNVNSYHREVTSLSLRLDDGGLEERRQQPALDRGRAMAAEAEIDLNITEISIPHSSSIKIQKRLAKHKQPEETARQSNQPSSDEAREQESSLGETKLEDARQEKAENNQKEVGKTEEKIKPDEEYAPEIEIIEKKNSGSTEESSRPPSSKKGFSKIFSRFGRKPKKSMSSSSTSANE